ncbi:MAG: methyltransferase type 12, partial [Gemmatimonadetes bacterium]|nr:methyltransferase type 12 [Gemmatimonadota bacterium]
MAKALKRSGTRSPSPQAFLDDLWAARRSLALAAAVELDVFTPIDRGQQTAAAVA